MLNFQYLLKSEWFEHSFSEFAHSKESIANDANDAVILGMERYFRDRVFATGHILHRGNHFIFLPEEVDQTSKSSFHD